MSSDTHDSILWLKLKPALEIFSWETVWLELQQIAPTLMALLVGLLPPSKAELDSCRPPLCMCASILLKLTNSKVNLAQTVISLILKAGHATKQVKSLVNHTKSVNTYKCIFFRIVRCSLDFRK